MNGDKDTLRDEYPEDLIRSGVRGKYAKRYREGTNIVLIDPDLPKLFPDSETVWIRDGFHHEHKREVPDASLMISGLSAPADSGRKNSFFGWGRARKPVLFLLWIIVLALACEDLYYDWAGLKPSIQYGPGMVLFAGILAAMYAPKRRFFGILWFFFGLVGSILAIGILSGLLRSLR